LTVKSPCHSHVTIRFLKLERVPTVAPVVFSATNQRVLFGKSRPTRSVETTRHWGSQKGSKYVRLYYKEEIEKDIVLRQGDVWPTLYYLRLEVGLKNARRLLVPLKINRLIREALKEWPATWPKAPTRITAA
jgi:hypothetical protein